MITKFSIFEKASILLENSPESVSDEVLLENNITREELEKINEGILGDAWKALKIGIMKKIPGNTVKKADDIIKKYKEAKLAIAAKSEREQDKIFKRKGLLEDPKKFKDDEQIVRSTKAIEAIEAASKSKIEAIQKQLDLLTRDKSDLVRDYIDMQLATIQEEIANKQLEAAEKYADEDTIKKLETDIANIKKQKSDAEKAIKAATEEEERRKKQSEEDKIKSKTKKEEDASKLANDPNNAKVGQMWKTKREHNVTIVELTDDKQVRAKGEHSPAVLMNRTNLDSLVKDVDVEKEKNK